MADFIQALDPAKLVLVETALSFATSAFAAPVYNLPIFLFGTYAQEASEAIQSLQTFTILVAASALYDIIWLARHEQNWLIRILSILILILKVRSYYMHVIHHLTSTQAPTVLAFAAALRQRGTQFSGLSFTGNNLNGATGTLLHVCSTTIT
ncbi:hypothetical protein BC629DRAFT_826329 [Irpex lacteus]|nr:hypothetical protein BC629DRAFT_826329 [Irpex lacteus]